MDNKHTLGLWDWIDGRLLDSRPTRNGDPPQLFDVVWHPPECVARNPATDFVTFGQGGHVTFWKYRRDPPGETAARKNARRPAHRGVSGAGDDGTFGGRVAGLGAVRAPGGGQLTSQKGRFGKHSTPRSTTCVCYLASGELVSGGRLDRSNGMVFLWAGNEVRHSFDPWHGPVTALCVGHCKRNGNAQTGDRAVAQLLKSFVMSWKKLGLKKLWR